MIIYALEQQKTDNNLIIIKNNLSQDNRFPSTINELLELKIDSLPIYNIYLCIDFTILHTFTILHNEVQLINNEDNLTYYIQFINNICFSLIYCFFTTKTNMVEINQIYTNCFKLLNQIISTNIVSKKHIVYKNIQTINTFIITQNQNYCQDIISLASQIEKCKEHIELLLWNNESKERNILKHDIVKTLLLISRSIFINTPELLSLKNKFDQYDFNLELFNINIINDKQTKYLNTNKLSILLKIFNSVDISPHNSFKNKKPSNILAQKTEIANLQDKNKQQFSDIQAQKTEIAHLQAKIQALINENQYLRSKIKDSNINHEILSLNCEKNVRNIIISTPEKFISNDAFLKSIIHSAFQSPSLTKRAPEL